MLLLTLIPTPTISTFILHLSKVPPVTIRAFANYYSLCYQSKICIDVFFRGSHLLTFKPTRPALSGAQLPSHHTTHHPSSGIGFTQSPGSNLAIDHYSTNLYHVIQTDKLYAPRISSCNKVIVKQSLLVAGFLDKTQSWEVSRGKRPNMRLVRRQIL